MEGLLELYWHGFWPSKISRRGILHTSGGGYLTVLAEGLEFKGIVECRTLCQTLNRWPRSVVKEPPHNHFDVSGCPGMVRPDLGSSNPKHSTSKLGPVDLEDRFRSIIRSYYRGAAAALLAGVSGL